jgi:DNA-binding IclR family transcriptional regulator
MAMPVLSKSGYPAGSLNVAMLSVRYSPKVRDLIAETLEAAARGLSGLSA